MSAAINKVKQVFSHDESTSSHNNTADRTSSDVGTTPSYSSAGDRSNNSTLDKAEAAVGAKSASTTSPGPTSITGTTHGSGIERGVEHLKEHAAPPQHHHNQPTKDGLLNEADAKAATHNHQHLAPVTHETHHHHETEEIERQREVDRHVHHIQHHTQPVLDTQHASEEHHQKIHPQTHIKENHVATDEDKAQFAGLNTARDTYNDAGREKTIIDKGENVHTNTHHHVSHVVQPVIERDTHEHHRTHTAVPVHHEVHEAPIVHQSTMHEPLGIKEFTQGGGDLSSKIKHDHNLLNVHGSECERTVDGPAETLASNLGLGSGSTTSANRGTTAPTSSGAAGTTGGAL
ncbi:hypothetical protein JCM10207_003435 [Rhodosporidiobolus poonsookiae]